MAAFWQSDSGSTLWPALESQMGSYVSYGEPTTASADGYDHYLFPTTFANGQLILQVTMEGGTLSGLHYSPADNQENANTAELRDGIPPAEDLPEGVVEQMIIVDKDSDMPLAGLLTLPADRSRPIPLVVLAQGSGPSNMDEQVASNRPFRDLAYGLAERGIAVIRYNKVTFAYPDRLPDTEHITAEIETIHSAVAAKAAAQEQASDVTFSDIYICGHSLGGILAPRIAEAGAFQGMIIMAGTTRSFPDILYSQNEYMINLPQLQLSDSEKASQKELLNALYAQAKEVLALPPDEMSGKTVMGLPAQYVYSLDNPAPAEVLARLDLPTLALQGDADFQVTASSDGKLMEQAMRELTDGTYREYEGLNHLFMPSTMEYPDTTDYNMPSHMDETVLDDIADWIWERNE
jgi:dienelactone hydrolase